MRGTGSSKSRSKPGRSTPAPAARSPVVPRWAHWRSFSPTSSSTRDCPDRHPRPNRAVAAGLLPAEKKWDLLVVADGQLFLAVEFKSQVGPSFGNNFNNRTEEAIGNAEDIWTAYREGRFGKHQAPFLGYFFLLEDCPRVHTPVANSEPYFPVDPVFNGASYAKRYEVLCERLVLERKYTSTCLTLATNDKPTQVGSPPKHLTSGSSPPQSTRTPAPSSTREHERPLIRIPEASVP